jgi:hypothetical protein
MMNEPRKRPEDEPSAADGDETAKPESSAGQATDTEIWAAVESQIDEILYEEDDEDPTNPAHPDYDLSTASPYRHVEPQPRYWFTARWVLLLIAIIAIGGMLIPYFRLF